MKKLFYFFAITMALVSIQLLAQEVNTSKYITLKVTKGASVNLDFRASDSDTPIRIVSGKHKEDLVLNESWYSEETSAIFTMSNVSNTIIIYGDIAGFNCSANLGIIKTIDLCKNSDLTELDCSELNIKTLDVSNCTELISLSCSWNQISTLDLSNNTKLTSLYCAFNEIRSLDVSYCLNLEELACASNNIKSLDISNNTQLKSFSCENNNIKSLDLSNNNELTTLECFSNKLTSLDLSNNTNLEMLACYDNPFSTNTVNMIYCSLPDRTDEDSHGECYIITDTIDPSPKSAQSATSDIAKKKNWQVKYSDDTEVPSKGNYKCK